MELTSENVEKMFGLCIDDSKEKTEGIMFKAGLNTDGHEAEIHDMLRQLPKPFQFDGGGGWSFLMACDRQDGEQWTGMHLVMDKLFMLGLAAGKVERLFPPEIWPNLPGGMPYYVVN